MDAGYPYFIKFVTRNLALRFSRVKAEQLRKHKDELIETMGKEKF